VAPDLAGVSAHCGAVTGAPDVGEYDSLYGVGVQRDLQHVEVAVEELVDRGLGTGAPLLVHLGQEAGADLLGLLGGLRPSWHDLGEVVPLLRDRVEARVHAHAVRPARQGLDLAPDSLPGLRRGGHGATARAGWLHV
jgi:hypothetical protein